MLRLKIALLLGAIAITCLLPSYAQAESQNGGGPPERLASPIRPVHGEKLVVSDQSTIQAGTVDIRGEVFQGMRQFWNSEIVGDFLPNVGQLFGKWISDWLNGWAADTVALLTAMLRTFFLNPNIALQGLSPQDPSMPSEQRDDISPLIHEAANVMYAIALDLLLVLFVLAIWRYWTEAAWRGGVGVMGALGRLIFTFGLTMAWPTICAIEIEISNQMISAVLLGSEGQIQMLDATMASAVTSGLVASTSLAAKSILPTFGYWHYATVGSSIGGAISAVALVVFLILAIVLIIQLILILVMKALQTVLLAAQFMFAPVFLIFFATPDTENVASSFIKSCVEVSLWTFVWVGLLKLMVILLSSLFSPWGKIIMAIAILQLMIQVPSFLARASISPISVLSASNFMTAGLKTNAVRLGSTLVEKSLSLASELTKSKTGDFSAPMEGARQGMGQSVQKPTPPPFDNTFSRSDATKQTTRVANHPIVLKRPTAKRTTNNSIASASHRHPGAMPSAARAANGPIFPPTGKPSMPSAIEDPSETSRGNSPSSVGALYQSARAVIESDNAPTSNLNYQSTSSPGMVIPDETFGKVLLNSSGTEERQNLQSNANHNLVPMPMAESIQSPTSQRSTSQLPGRSIETSYPGSPNRSLENSPKTVEALYQRDHTANEANRSISNSGLGVAPDPISIETSIQSIGRVRNRSASRQPIAKDDFRSKDKGNESTIEGATSCVVRSENPRTKEPCDLSATSGPISLSVLLKNGRLKPPLQASRSVQNPAAPALGSQASRLEDSSIDSGPTAKHSCQSSPCSCSNVPQLPPPRTSDIRNELKEERPFAQSYSGFESE